MNTFGSATNSQSLSSLLNPSNIPVFSDNVQDILGDQLGNRSIISVNSIDDVGNNSDGVTTLREAIDQANADAGHDLIVFERSLFSSTKTITLNLGELNITQSLDIIAPRDELTGEDLLTVSGNNATRVFEIGRGATVSIDGLIIADGKIDSDDGGDILNSGILILDRSIIQNGSASNGGGMANSDGAILTVNNSTLGNNSAAFFGGGIYNTNSTVQVRNSTIKDNSARFGGGIESFDSFLTVSNSTLGNNSATSDGGGIDFFGSVNSFLTVSNSTLNNNSASEGGGIHSSDGIVKISNSTLSGNTADNHGGAVFNNTTLTLVFSTLTLNQAADGGGVFNNTFGSTVVRNTIIAANRLSAGGINPDVSGNFDPIDENLIDNSIAPLGYNLIGDGTGSSGFDEATGDIVGTSNSPINPGLAPLDFYGGPTQTQALLPDSPAIGAGNPNVLDTDPTTDQRGFPRVIDGRVDIGAFQFS